MSNGLEKSRRSPNDCLAIRLIDSQSVRDWWWFSSEACLPCKFLSQPHTFRNLQVKKGKGGEQKRTNTTDNKDMLEYLLLFRAKKRSNPNYLKTWTGHGTQVVVFEQSLVWIQFWLRFPLEKSASPQRQINSTFILFESWLDKTQQLKLALPHAPGVNRLVPFRRQKCMFTTQDWC